MDKRFQWTSFYMELASALLKYKNNRSELIGILKTIFSDVEMNFPFKEKGKEVYEDICPFTVFGSFNKGITNANRIALLEQFAKQFSIKAAVPTEFDGIPVVMNLSAWFFAYKENRGEHDIDNLWELLEKAIAYSDEASEDNKNAFITAYDTVSKQKMIKWNITMGLYWVRPYTFINLDSEVTTPFPMILCIPFFTKMTSPILITGFTLRVITLVCGTSFTISVLWALVGTM